MEKNLVTWKVAGVFCRPVAYQSQPNLPTSTRKVAGFFFSFLGRPSDIYNTMMPLWFLLLAKMRHWAVECSILTCVSSLPFAHQATLFQSWPLKKWGRLVHLSWTGETLLEKEKIELSVIRCSLNHFVVSFYGQQSKWVWAWATSNRCISEQFVWSSHV